MSSLLARVALILGVCNAPTAAQQRLAFLVDSDVDALFSIGNSGGATRVGSTASALTDPAGLTWQEDARLLWTIDFAGGEIGTLDTTTAAFTHRFTATPASGWQGIDRDPTTGQFWLINGDGNLYRLDPTTGSTTRVGATGVGLLTALETDAAGTLWSIGFQNGVLYRIDKTTGVASAVVTTTPIHMQGLSFGPDGRLFASNSTTDSLYLINPTTGTTTLTGPHGANVRFSKGFEITYALGSAVRSGAGCPAGQSVSFYELFAPSTFDLANRAIQMVPLGSGYRVSPSTNALVPPISALVPRLADDALSSPLALPFVFPYPGGSTSQIRICSNGFVHLDATASSADFTPTAGESLTAGPRLFALWMDLDPGATGSGPVFYDVDVAQGRARITWQDVLEYQGANTNTFQIELRASGAVEYRWGNAGNLGVQHDALVGFSPGASNRDPGPRDLSTSMPFVTSADVFALEQDASRPVIGQNLALRVSGIHAGSVAGAELFGLPLPGSGIDLSAAGMPGCTQYVFPLFVSLPFATTGSSSTLNVAIPNDGSLLGGRVAVQAAVITPGINAAGLVTSGLVTLTIGEV